MAPAAAIRYGVHVPPDPGRRAKTCRRQGVLPAALTELTSPLRTILARNLWSAGIGQALAAALDPPTHQRKTGMTRDKTQIYKGMRMVGAAGPSASLPFSRRDLVKQGTFLTSDAGGPVMIKSSAPAPRYGEPTPSLAEIHRRLDVLGAKIEVAAAGTQGAVSMIVFGIATTPHAIDGHVLSPGCIDVTQRVPLYHDHECEIGQVIQLCYANSNLYVWAETNHDALALKLDFFLPAAAPSSASSAPTVFGTSASFACTRSA